MQPPKRRPRGPSRYRRRETTRLVRGVLDAGLPVRGVEVDPVTGALRVLAGKPDEPVDNSNPWDKVLNAQDAKRTS
jgi:hypothetical protein